MVWDSDEKDQGDEGVNHCNKRGEEEHVCIILSQVEGNKRREHFVVIKSQISNKLII